MAAPIETWMDLSIYHTLLAHTGLPYEECLLDHASSTPQHGGGYMADGLRLQVDLHRHAEPTGQRPGKNPAQILPFISSVYHSTNDLENTWI